MHKGEISNNTAINNGKIFLITPKNDKNTKIYEIFSCIYGAAIYSISSKFEMLPKFIIKNNFCELNTNINIEKNCFIESAIHSAIRGGQLYFNNSQINIRGGLIQNGKNNSKINLNIFNKNDIEKQKKIFIESQGGGMNFINCKDIEIKNLNIEKCNSDKGGAIFFTSCKGIISDSIFESNFAKGFGGAIFINKNNSEFQLINNKILNNITEEGSGGGISAQGKILIDGINTLISDNIAATYGGGVMIKNEAVMKNGKICHNKALKNCGGGIRVDGTFELIDGKISKNWANDNGGGINSQLSKKFEYDNEKIDKIVYKNIAKNKGNDLFPLKKKKEKIKNKK